MPYVRYEFHETLTVAIEPNDLVPAGSGRLPALPRQIGLPARQPTALPSPHQNEALRWLAPTILAAGVVIAREVARSDALPRIKEGVRARMLTGRRLLALPASFPLALAARNDDDARQS